MSPDYGKVSRPPYDPSPASHCPSPARFDSNASLTASFSLAVLARAGARIASLRNPNSLPSSGANYTCGICGGKALGCTSPCRGQCETERGQLLRRQWHVPLTCVGAGVLVAACGQPMGKISDQPHDLSSGRALARAVTHKTGCGYIEDFSLPAADHWNFSCQYGEDLFVIHTANSEAAETLDDRPVFRSTPARSTSSPPPRKLAPAHRRQAAFGSFRGRASTLTALLHSTPSETQRA